MLTERMDPVKASPFELGNPRADRAALLIHGFTGTPWDMLPLGEALADRGFYVRGMRLPGHGLTPHAMLSASADHWVHAVLTEVDALTRSRAHRPLFLSGLSMGALLSVLAAAARPGKIAGLGLLAPAMRLRDQRVELLRRIGRLDVLAKLRPWVRKDASDIADPEALREAPMLSSWPTQRLFDLFSLQARVRTQMAHVTCPALVMTALKDHVVTPEGGHALARGLVRSPRVRLIRLDQGFHIMPRDFGRERVAKEVGDFFVNECERLGAAREG